MLPLVGDRILRENVLLSRILGAAKKGKWEGETMKKTIKVAKNTTGGFFTGYDLLDTTATDNLKQMSFAPAFRYKTVSLAGTDLTINAISSTKIIDLAAQQMESASKDLADDMGNDFYAGVGTGITMNGLGNILDDGTTAATYGGLTRATYPALSSTKTASGGVISFAKLATLYNAISDGSMTPTVGVCDRTTFSLIESLFLPMQRIETTVDMYKGGLKGGTGFTALMYKGIPIIADRKATSGTFYFINEDALDFFSVNPEGAAALGFEAFKFKTVEDGTPQDYGQPMGLGFSWGGWKKPINQFAVVSQILFAGNFISWDPRRMGSLTGVSSV